MRARSSRVKESYSIPLSVITEDGIEDRKGLKLVSVKLPRSIYAIRAWQTTVNVPIGPAHQITSELLEKTHIHRKRKYNT